MNYELIWNQFLNLDPQLTLAIFTASVVTLTSTATLLCCGSRISKIEHNQKKDHKKLVKVISSVDVLSTNVNKIEKYLAEPDE